jgi:hypothetical protein
VQVTQKDPDRPPKYSGYLKIPNNRDDICLGHRLLAAPDRRVALPSFPLCGGHSAVATGEPPPSTYCSPHEVKPPGGAHSPIPAQKPAGCYASAASAQAGGHGRQRRLWDSGSRSVWNRPPGQVDRDQAIRQSALITLGNPPRSSRGEARTCVIDTLARCWVAVQAAHNIGLDNERLFARHARNPLADASQESRRRAKASGRSHIRCISVSVSRRSHGTAVGR